MISAFSISSGYWIIYSSFGLATVGSIVYLHMLPQLNIPTETFRCPLFPLLPCLGILGNFVLIAEFDFMTWVYFLSYTVVGIVFYFVYGIKNSKLNKYDYN